MSAAMLIKNIASFEECVSWAQADANLGTPLTDHQLASLQELWDKGTCFSLVRTEREIRHYTECLITAVPTHPGEFIMINRDVTAIYAELDILRDFFENGNYSLRCVALDGTILRQELQLLGYPLEQYVGQNINKFYVDSNVAQGYFQRLLDGERLVDVEAALYHRDGSVRWLRINSTVRFSKCGKFMHTRCFTVDITDRKKLELELQKAQSEAEAASEAKDRFIAALSHELRTPLTPVLFSLSLLQDDQRLPADVREQVASMLRCTELEVRLVDDLLDLSAIRRGVFRCAMCDIDVHTILSMARDTVFVGDAALLRECRMKLGAGRHFVRGDNPRLQQVFRNILRNAVNFTSTGGLIEMETSETADSITVRITDNGAGMDGALLSRLFVPFTSGNTTAAGLGLGLSISKSIITLHGGTISAHSEGVDRGTTVLVSIPLLPQFAGASPSTRLPAMATSSLLPNANSSPKSRNVPLVSPRRRASVATCTGAIETISNDGIPAVVRKASGKGPLNVLVVEDNAACRAVFVRAVRNRLGHAVDEAVTLADALQLWRSKTYDLIISDIGLPDGTGHDLMLEVARNGKRQRAIACSGYGMEADIATSMRVGFQKHLTKPVSFKDLERAIEEVTADA